MSRHGGGGGGGGMEQFIPNLLTLLADNIIIKVCMGRCWLNMYMYTFMLKTMQDGASLYIIRYQTIPAAIETVSALLLS